MNLKEIKDKAQYHEKFSVMESRQSKSIEKHIKSCSKSTHKLFNGAL